MVVSYQKKFITIFISALILLIPSSSFCEVRELTDAELDSVIATNFSQNLMELILANLEEIPNLEESFNDISFALDQALLESLGLINIHAINSEVHVQSNFLFVIGSPGSNIIQSNFIQ